MKAIHYIRKAIYWPLEPLLLTISRLPIGGTEKKALARALIGALNAADAPLRHVLLSRGYRGQRP